MLFLFYTIVARATKSQPEALARDSAGNHASKVRFHRTPFVPQGRATRGLGYSRQGLRSLATLSLAYATGCDGGTRSVLPLISDAQRALPILLKCFAALVVVVCLFCIPAMAFEERVRLTRTDGGGAEGELVKLTTESGVLRSGTEEITIPLPQIGTVEFTQAKALSSPPPMELALVDGSRLRGVALSGSGVAWTLQSEHWKLDQPSPPKQLHFLMVRPINLSQEAGWKEALEDSSPSDGLVLARPNGEITKVGGTILSVKENTVSFEFDDQKLEMSLDRLLGMTWFQPTSNRMSQGAVVKTIDGSLWHVKSVERIDGNYRVESVAGLRATIPPASLLELQLGAANTGWVYDAPRLEASAEPSEAWKFISESANKAFVPRFVVDSAAKQNADPSSSDYDLEFTRGGAFTFRMPDGFRQLESTVRRTRQGNLRSTVTIQVWQDSDKVFEGTLEPDQEALEVKAELTSEKRIKLVVTTNSPTHIGTEVQWKQPRLLK